MLIDLDRFFTYRFKAPQATDFSPIWYLCRPRVFVCRGPNHSLENRIRRNTEMYWRVESMRIVVLPCCSPFGPVKSIRSTLPLRPGESAVAKASPKRRQCRRNFSQRYGMGSRRIDFLFLSRSLDAEWVSACIDRIRKSVLKKHQAGTVFPVFLQARTSFWDRSHRISKESGCLEFPYLSC